MEATTHVNERLTALTEAGTSVWLDQIRRGMTVSGELERLIREDCLRGQTSNPAIFEKAILGSTDYDEQISELAQQDKNAVEIYEEVAIKDVQMAADVLRSVYDESGGEDGFVSLEVEPEIAHDTDRTIEQAHEFWERVDRPNLMIKIPGTDEGVPAIESCLADGININITLLFSVEAYQQVVEAYLKAMETRHERGDSVDIASVASFFVSRVDSEVDKRLDEMDRKDLRGKAAVANARAAYMHFKDVFEGGERFAKLREAGCRVQRPLWASTGVKDPAYKETKYVEELVAPHTVNTMPMPTLLACAEELEVTGPTADQDPTSDLEALAEAGIDMKDVTDKLLRDGITKFVEPFDELIGGIELVREGIVTGRPPTISSTIPDDLEPAIIDKVKEAQSENVAQGIWRHDETLWGGPAPEIGNRLGWLTISEKMLEHGDDLREFVEEVKSEGYTNAVLLGMGGSSLGPEVIRRSYGEIPEGLRLQVLDSTDPEAVLEVERSVDLDKTLFIVSSKSGGTIETLSHMRYFYERSGKQGSHFVAITDPGSALIDEADSRGFRRVFENDPDIGGRYSVLSYFGMVPAALMGVNVEHMLHRAQVAEQNCTGYNDSHSNSGLWLGIVMGELALQGRDKLTFVVSDPIASFGLWAEQLIAESTGKEGKGILPVAGEPLGEPDSYGEDRMFVYLRNPDEPDKELDQKIDALGKAGHPTVTLAAHGAADLGRIFFFAEFATAVAGWVLGINPFDQPNVQEAKDNTAKVLEGGELPEVPEAEDLSEILAKAEPPHYVAIMGYAEPSDEFDRAIDELRAAIRDKTKATTTFGYGPRFLHSTGQFHKGGPPVGLFVQLVDDDPTEIEIPEAGYTFGHLKEAQATGDYLTLRDHDLPVVRIRLGADSAQAVRNLTQGV
jgi:transaldolase / glucose-6-phosphate isomerase